MSNSNKTVHPFFQIKKPAKKKTPDPLLSPSTPSPSKPDRPRSNYSKGESSRPHYTSIKKPLFYSDNSSKPKLSYTFYGPTTTTTTTNATQLARDLFHVTDKPFEHSDPPPHRHHLDLTSLIQQHNVFMCLDPPPRPMQQQHRSVTKPRITNHQELTLFLDMHFPHWQTFPSCCLLSQRVWQRETSQKPWAEKYRPKHLNGLVGARHNYLYLKEWLHQMKIEPLSAPSGKSTTSTRHRRKKQKKIFVDGHGDEEEEDDDDFVLTPKKKTTNKKPNMRSNIILLVGDSGVGKTAAVYTIADQLQYQVFEIHAGSKRSGKDLVAMVGEMTKSHLVRFQPSVPSIFQVPAKKKRLAPTFAPSTRLPSQKKTTTTTTKTPSPPSTAIPTQQSLILLEEVDLLFEEDKGFWASVVELSQKSKRPIVMTCNDPDQVPFEDLCIQSVLDIQPPSDSELLPYIWLVCFTEGYIIDPSDLICLMAFLGRDVRQLLHTLELYAGDQVFEKYLGLHSEMDLGTMKQRCVPSRLAIDTFRLARFCQGHQQQSMEQEEDFDALVKAIDNNAFMDSYVSMKGNGNRVHEHVEDQLNGFTALWLEDDDDTPSTWLLNEIETHVSVLNSQIPKTDTWARWVMDESSHWQVLSEASLNTFETYREAIEKLLPLQLIYQPHEQTIMMDYIPHIQNMLLADTDKKSSRSTRSKRKRLYLPLNEDCVDTLTKDNPLVDETDIWIQRISNSL